MKITRAMRMLRAINILHNLGGGGEGLTAGEAGKWAGLPYSTSHRYMAWLRKLKLVERHKTQSKDTVYRYTLTSEGKSLLHGQLESPL